jgi:hypothetical protein
LILANAVGALLVVGVIVGGFITVLTFVLIADAKRRKAMAQLAAQWGYQFYPAPGDVATQFAGQFDLFNAGHSRQATNMIRGREGATEMKFFDYRYMTGSGKHRRTHAYQVMLVELPIVAPRLVVRTENFLDTLASWVGHDDLDFESAEFSRRYHVKCSEPKFAYDVLHARLIEQWLALPDTPHLKMVGTTLLLYIYRGAVSEFQWLRTAGLEVIGGLPEYVLKDRGVNRT